MFLIKILENEIKCILGTCFVEISTFSAAIIGVWVWSCDWSASVQVNRSHSANDVEETGDSEEFLASLCFLLADKNEYTVLYSWISLKSGRFNGSDYGCMAIAEYLKAVVSISTCLL